MKKTQSGFTLIEIAIVMVIIGLLLGGVLKGQSMINSAKVRSLNNNVDGIAAAWFAFQDRYRAIPGDMTNAAVQIGGNAVNNATGTTGTVDSFLKSSILWNQVSAAGFISGSYPGAPAVAGVNTCATTLCPDNRFGLGFVINFPASVAASAPFTSQGHYLYTGLNIPVTIVAELDRKIDDGIPQTGSVRTGIAACFTGTGATSTYNIAVPSNSCALAISNL